MSVSFVQRLAGFEAELQSIEASVLAFVLAVQEHEPNFGLYWLDDGHVFSIMNRGFTYTMMVDYWTDDTYTNDPPNPAALAEFQRLLPTEEEGNALLRLMDLLQGKEDE